MAVALFPSISPPPSKVLEISLTIQGAEILREATWVRGKSYLFFDLTS